MLNNNTQPHLYIVGAHKAATTSVHGLLQNHPAVSMSSTKETHFLTPSLKHRLHTGIWDPEEYSALWDHASSNQLRGESSVFYLPNAREFVNSLDSWAIKEPLVIAILREPVSRAYSAYLDEKLKNPEEDRATFEDAIGSLTETSQVSTNSPALEYLRNGLYADDVAVLRAALGDRLKVLTYDALIDRPGSTLREVWSFLGLSGESPISLDFRNNTGGREWRSGKWEMLLKNPSVVHGRRFLSRRAPELHLTLKRLAQRRLTTKAHEISPDAQSQLRAFYSTDIRRLRDEHCLNVSGWQ